jgi:hypothetical protein
LDKDESEEDKKTESKKIDNAEIAELFKEIREFLSNKE